MFRFTVGLLAGALLLAASADAGLAADLAPFPARPDFGQRVPGPTRPPLYSYYGEYQYPVPFGYGRVLPVDIKPHRFDS